MRSLAKILLLLVSHQAQGQCWTQPEYVVPAKLDTMTAKAFTTWIRSFQHPDGEDVADWLKYTYQLDIDNDQQDEIIIEGGTNGGGVSLYAFERSDSPRITFTHKPAVELAARAKGNVYKNPKGLYVKLCDEIFLDFDVDDQFIKNDGSKPACVRKNWRKFQYYLARRAFDHKEIAEAKSYIAETLGEVCKSYLSSSEAKSWGKLSQEIDALLSDVSWSTHESLYDLCLKMPLLSNKPDLQKTARALFAMDADRSAMSPEECAINSKRLEQSESLNVPHSCWLQIADLRPLTKLPRLKRLRLNQSAARCWGMTIETKDWSPLKQLPIDTLDLAVIGTDFDTIIASALRHLPENLRHLKIRTFSIDEKNVNLLKNLQLESLRIDVHKDFLDDVKRQIVNPSIKVIEVQVRDAYTLFPGLEK